MIIHKGSAEVEKYSCHLGTKRRPEVVFRTPFIYYFAEALLTLCSSLSPEIINPAKSGKEHKYNHAPFVHGGNRRRSGPIFECAHIDDAVDDPGFPVKIGSWKKRSAVISHIDSGRASLKV
jgi:hypothetical protein